jgi:glutaredoxin-like protein NrdH
MLMKDISCSVNSINVKSGHENNKEDGKDKMQTVKVPGKNNKHKVLLYAISTCGWCKRAKKFLNDNNVEYEYVDIDLSSGEDREKIRQDIQSRGGRLAYPTIIIDNKILLTGASPDKLREVLEI